MRPKRILMSAEEMREQMEDYFYLLDSNPERRGGPSSLLVALGLDFPTVQWLMSERSPKYQRHLAVLREAALRLRGHLETAPAWSGSNGSKAMALRKQVDWDGFDGGDGNSAQKPLEIIVRFSGGENAFD